MAFPYREQIMLSRARKILGVDVDTEPQRVRYAYYKVMAQCHPDKNPDTPQAQELAALAAEAYALVTGRSSRFDLLADEELVQTALGHGLAHLDGVMSYEQWLQEQFLDMEKCSIWSY